MLTLCQHSKTIPGQKLSHSNTISHGLTSPSPHLTEAAWSHLDLQWSKTEQTSKEAPNHNKGCVKNKGGRAKDNLVRTVQTLLLPYMLFCPFTFPPVSRCLRIYLHIYLERYKWLLKTLHSVICIQFSRWLLGQDGGTVLLHSKKVQSSNPSCGWDFLCGDFMSCSGTLVPPTPQKHAVSGVGLKLWL